MEMASILSLLSHNSIIIDTDEEEIIEIDSSSDSDSSSSDKDTELDHSTSDESSESLIGQDEIVSTENYDVDPMTMNGG